MGWPPVIFVATAAKLPAQEAISFTCKPKVEVLVVTFIVLVASHFSFLTLTVYSPPSNPSKVKTDSFIICPCGVGPSSVTQYGGELLPTTTAIDPFVSQEELLLVTVNSMVLV